MPENYEVMYTHPSGATATFVRQDGELDLSHRVPPPVSRHESTSPGQARSPPDLPLRRRFPVERNEQAAADPRHMPSVADRGRPEHGWSA